MKPWTTKQPREFTFAGFDFPKFVFTLPKGSFKERLARAKDRIAGPYYHAPKPNSKSGQGFYLQSDGASDLRWQWCDDIATSIEHTGWWTDDDGSGDKIRGIVFRLPKGRGFLIGWSMGKGMASAIETDYVYGDEDSAARAADSLAEQAAEEEREGNEQEPDDDEPEPKVYTLDELEALKDEYVATLRNKNKDNFYATDQERGELELDEFFTWLKEKSQK